MSTTTWENITSEWKRLTEYFSDLHKEDLFLPESFIKGSVIPAIFLVAVALSIIFLLSFLVVDKLVPPNADGQRKAKACYQVTNVIFNLCVGVIGLYLEYWVLPTLDCFGKESIDRATGNAPELYLVSAMQMGYQLWAIPVGLFYVGESVEMLLHHCAVVVSTSFSGFLNIGFRYYTPFFYGIMELSSLPLSAMNSFKDNPELIEKYPRAYSLTRVVFCITFLFIRVFMCAWRWPIFLRDNFLVFWTREMGLAKLYFLVQWSLASFLAYLQLFWASLIVKGLIKTVSPKKGQKKKTL